MCICMVCFSNRHVNCKHPLPQWFWIRPCRDHGVQTVLIIMGGWCMSPQWWLSAWPDIEQCSPLPALQCYYWVFNYRTGISKGVVCVCVCTSEYRYSIITVYRASDEGFTVDITRSTGLGANSSAFDFAWRVSRVHVHHTSASRGQVSLGYFFSYYVDICAFLLLYSTLSRDTQVVVRHARRGTLTSGVLATPPCARGRDTRIRKWWTVSIADDPFLSTRAVRNTFHLLSTVLFYPFLPPPPLNDKLAYVSSLKSMERKWLLHLFIWGVSCRFPVLWPCYVFMILWPFTNPNSDF